MSVLPASHTHSFLPNPTTLPVDDPGALPRS
jgi:hypothetical protein